MRSEACLYIIRRSAPSDQLHSVVYQGIKFMVSWRTLTLLGEKKKGVDERPRGCGYIGWEGSWLTRRFTRLRDGGLNVIPLGN